jgi:hypothetical protein
MPHLLGCKRTKGSQPALIQELVFAMAERLLNTSEQQKKPKPQTASTRAEALVHPPGDTLGDHPHPNDKLAEFALNETWKKKGGSPVALVNGTAQTAVAPGRARAYLPRASSNSDSDSDLLTAIQAGLKGKTGKNEGGTGVSTTPAGDLVLVNNSGGRNRSIPAENPNPHVLVANNGAASRGEAAQPVAPQPGLRSLVRTDSHGSLPALRFTADVDPPGRAPDPLQSHRTEAGPGQHNVTSDLQGGAAVIPVRFNEGGPAGRTAHRAETPQFPSPQHNATNLPGGAVALGEQGDKPGGNVPKAELFRPPQFNATNLPGRAQGMPVTLGDGGDQRGGTAPQQLLRAEMPPIPSPQFKVTDLQGGPEPGTGAPLQRLDSGRVPMDPQDIVRRLTPMAAGNATKLEERPTRDNSAVLADQINAALTEKRGGTVGETVQPALGSGDRPATPTFSARSAQNVEALNRPGQQQRITDASSLLQQFGPGQQRDSRNTGFVTPINGEGQTRSLALNPAKPDQGVDTSIRRGGSLADASIPRTGSQPRAAELPVRDLQSLPATPKHPTTEPRSTEASRPVATRDQPFVNPGREETRARALTNLSLPERDQPPNAKVADAVSRQGTLAILSPKDTVVVRDTSLLRSQPVPDAGRVPQTLTAILGKGPELSIVPAVDQSTLRNGRLLTATVALNTVPEKLGTNPASREASLNGNGPNAIQTRLPANTERAVEPAKFLPDSRPIISANLSPNVTFVKGPDLKDNIPTTTIGRAGIATLVSTAIKQDTTPLPVVKAGDTPVRGQIFTVSDSRSNGLLTARSGVGGTIDGSKPEPRILPTTFVSDRPISTAKAPGQGSLTPTEVTSRSNPQPIVRTGTGTAFEGSKPETRVATTTFVSDRPINIVKAAGQGSPTPTEATLRPNPLPIVRPVAGTAFEGSKPETRIAPTTTFVSDRAIVKAVQGPPTSEANTRSIQWNIPPIARPGIGTANEGRRPEPIVSTSTSARTPAINIVRSAVQGALTVAEATPKANILYPGARIGRQLSGSDSFAVIGKPNKDTSSADETNARRERKDRLAQAGFDGRKAGNQSKEDIEFVACRKNREFTGAEILMASMICAASIARARVDNKTIPIRDHTGRIEHGKESLDGEISDETISAFKEGAIDGLLGCAPGGVATSAGDHTEASEEEETAANTDAQRNSKKTNVPAATFKRATILIKPGDTLVSLAEKYYNDTNVAWLILDLNRDSIVVRQVAEGTLAEVQARQRITLPVWQDIVNFYLDKAVSRRRERLLTLVVENQIDKELNTSVLGPILAPNQAKVTA